MTRARRPLQTIKIERVVADFPNGFLTEGGHYIVGNYKMGEMAPVIFDRQYRTYLPAYRGRKATKGKVIKRPPDVRGKLGQVKVYAVTADYWNNTRIYFKSIDADGPDFYIDPDGDGALSGIPPQYYQWWMEGPLAVCEENVKKGVFGLTNGWTSIPTYVVEFSVGEAAVGGTTTTFNGVVYTRYTATYTVRTIHNCTTGSPMPPTSAWNYTPMSFSPAMDEAQVDSVTFDVGWFRLIWARAWLDDDENLKYTFMGDVEMGLQINVIERYYLVRQSVECAYWDYDAEPPGPTFDYADVWHIVPKSEWPGEYPPSHQWHTDGVAYLVIKDDGEEIREMAVSQGDYEEAHDPGRRIIGHGSAGFSVDLGFYTNNHLIAGVCDVSSGGPIQILNYPVGEVLPQYQFLNPNGVWLDLDPWAWTEPRLMMFAVLDPATKTLAEIVTYYGRAIDNYSETVHQWMHLKNANQKIDLGETTAIGYGGTWWTGRDHSYRGYYLGGGIKDKFMGFLYNNDRFYNINGTFYHLPTDTIPPADVGIFTPSDVEYLYAKEVCTKTVPDMAVDVSFTQNSRLYAILTLKRSSGNLVYNLNGEYEIYFGFISE